MRRGITIVTVSLLALALLLVHSSSHAADYFPLKLGNRWVYSPSYGDGVRVDKIVKMEVNEFGLLTYVWQRTEAPPDNYVEKRWLAKSRTAVKVYKYWDNEGGFTDPLLINLRWKQDMLIPDVGDTWSYQLSIGAVTYTVTYTVESINATVNVPAGRFTNCIRIRQLDKTTEGPTTKFKYKKRWLAPGVGPVMYNSYGTNWAGLTFSQKLISYTIK